MKFSLILFFSFVQFGFSQAIIKFESTTIDVGTILYGEKLIITFPFVNNGNDLLIISNAQTSGGGLIFHSYPKKPISPNEKGIIEMLYDTKRIGSFNKSGIITYNGSENSRIELKVKGKVIASPILSTKSKFHNNINPKNGEELSFEIYNAGTATLHIKKIDGINHTVRLIPEKDSLVVGESMKLSYRLYSNNKNEAFNYTWKLYNNSKEEEVEFHTTGTLSYTPLSYTSDTVYLNEQSGSVKFIETKCHNLSNDTIEVFTVSKSSSSKYYDVVEVWMPGKQVYGYSTSYKIAPNETKRLLVAYRNYDFSLMRDDLIFYAKNLKSKAEYQNYATIYFKLD